MCIKEVRLCQVCGWTRVWMWTKCATYIKKEIACCMVGERAYRPEECSETKEDETGSVWALACPPLQCGNMDCPSMVHEAEARREVDEKIKQNLLECKLPTRMSEVRTTRMGNGRRNRGGVVGNWARDPGMPRATPVKRKA